MCGINGILSDNSNIKGKIASLNKLVIHRGPDDEGFVCINTATNFHTAFSGDDSVQAVKKKLPHISTVNFSQYNLLLGHRRLSVIDLTERGHCPMSDDEEKIWITYNGEIYNYIELREELRTHGYLFRTCSDTEVIIKAYQKWGENCFEHFNGMWSFALWDSIENKLILSRDRFGVKPLYYINNNECFAFSSEIKPMLELLPRTFEVNHKKIPFFIIQGNKLGTDETYITDVYSLNPSHYLVLKDGKVNIKRYYKIDTEKKINRNKRHLKEELINLLSDSIKLRYRSDVPVGTCLSGGLDSSSIVALSHKIFGGQLKTFSAVWSYSECDESKYINIINKEFGCDPYKTEPDVNEFEQVFKKLCYFQEIPTEGPGLYPQWYVMKMAKNKVKVLLDGQGGDEVFGGYLTKKHFFRSLLYDRNYRELSANLALLRSFLNKDGILTFFNWLFPESFNRFFVSAFTKKFNIIKKEVRQYTGITEMYSANLPEKQFEHYLNNLSIFFINNLTIPALLHYEDRSSMAHSIESRVPFLDYRLVEFGVNLSPDCLADKLYTRPLYRSAVSEILPKAITERKDKLGYPVPFNKWTRNSLKELINDIFENPASEIFNYIDMQYLKVRMEKHFKEEIDYSWNIWRLLSLNQFLEMIKKIRNNIK